MAVDWKARIAAAQAAAAAAKGAITDDDRAEMDARAEVAKADAERKAAEHEKREIDLARRFDQAEEALPGVLLAKVSLQDREDTFIVRCDPEAHAQWEAGLQAAATNKKINMGDLARTYAAKVIVDWNGRTDLDDTVTFHELTKFLKNNAGMVSPITSAAMHLAGFFAEERKS